jgi:hypothetical protein
MQKYPTMPEVIVPAIIAPQLKCKKFTGLIFIKG